MSLHDSYGFLGVIWVSIWVWKGIHLLLRRFYLYFEVWMLRFIQCSRFIVGEVMINRENIREFSSSISRRRRLRFNEEYVFKLRKVYRLYESLWGVCLPRPILTILLTIPRLFYSINFFCSIWDCMGGECLGAFLVLIWLLAVSMFMRCFFCAWVRSIISRRSLLLLRFQTFECI